MLRTLHQSRSDDILYVDPEFLILDGKYVLVEITILNSAGQVVLSTTVVHKDRSWPQIMVAVEEQANLSWTRGFMRKLGSDKEMNPPAGRSMTSPAIRAVLLRSGYSAECEWIEWSTCMCDFYTWREYLNTEGHTDLISSKKNVHRMLFPWRSILPGFWTFKLEIIFQLMHPVGPLEGQLSLFTRRCAQAFSFGGGSVCRFAALGVFAGMALMIYGICAGLAAMNICENFAG